MEENFQCNICNLSIESNEIENHINTQNHKNSKNEFIQQLNSEKREIFSSSTYYDWKKSQKKLN